jgi:hypothetical protein
VFRSDLAAFPQSLTLDARLEPDGWNGTLATEDVLDLPITSALADLLESGARP